MTDDFQRYVVVHLPQRLVVRPDQRLLHLRRELAALLSADSRPLLRVEFKSLQRPRYLDSLDDPT